VVVIKNLKRYVALKIEFDPFTGKRAGDISPHDPGLLCPGWQNLEEGVEIRLVVDDRDIEKYRDIPGVEVIEGVENIDNEILKICKPKYVLANPELFRVSIAHKNIDLSDIDSSLPIEKQLETLRKRGALGIDLLKPKLLSEMIGKKE